MNISLKNPMQRLGAAGTALALSSSAAFAQNGGTSIDIANMSNIAANNIYSTSILISTASYIAGIAFALAGLLHLKKHAEEPGREPISKGLGRLGVGALLCALPFAISTAMNSLGVDETASVGVTGSTNRF